MSTDGKISADPNLYTDTGEKLEENDVWPVVNTSQGVLGSEHVTHAQGAIANGREYLHGKAYGALANGVNDDASALQAAFDDLANIDSVAGLFLSPGHYIVNSPLNMPPNSSLRGDRVHLDFRGGSGFTDNTCILCLGRTPLTLPSQVSATIKGNRNWTFVTPHNLAVGDVIRVWDTTDFSYSGYRSYYQTMEHFVVQDVVDTVTIKTRQEAIFPWATSPNVSWSKYYEDTPTIDGRIKITAPPGDAHYCILMQNVIYPYLRGIKLLGPDRTAIRFDNTYGLVMDSCMCGKDLADADSQFSGLSYGVEYHAGQDATFDKCILHGDRHAFVTGGPGLNVNLNLDSCTLTGNIQNALDFHGNTIQSRANNCSIHPGISIAGNHNRVSNSHITGRDPYAIRMVEMKGGDFLFDDNVIDLGIGDWAIGSYNDMPHCTEGGTVRINGLHVIFDRAPVWIYYGKIDTDGEGPSGKIDYEFTDISYDSDGTLPAQFSIQLEHGDGASQNSAVPAGRITIRDCDLPGGIWLNWFDKAYISGGSVENAHQYGLRCTNMTEIVRVGEMTVEEWGDNYYGFSFDGHPTSNVDLIELHDITLKGGPDRGVTFSHADLVVFDGATFVQDLAPFQVYVATTVTEFRGSGFHIPDMTQVELLGSKHYLTCTIVGDPESNLIGSRGSSVRRRDGTEGPVLYVKESGDGATGWVVTPNTITDWHTINTGAGGTGTVTPITLLPAGCILENIVVHVGENFNGTQDHFVDVGDATTFNKYIDRADLVDYAAGVQHAMLGGTTNPQKQPEYIAAQTQLNVTWTNNNDATTGQITVAVTYTRQ